MAETEVSIDDVTHYLDGQAKDLSVLGLARNRFQKISQIKDRLMLLKEDEFEAAYQLIMAMAQGKANATAEKNKKQSDRSTMLPELALKISPRSSESSSDKIGRL